MAKPKTTKPPKPSTDSKALAVGRIAATLRREIQTATDDKAVTRARSKALRAAVRAMGDEGSSSVPLASEVLDYAAATAIKDRDATNKAKHGAASRGRPLNLRATAWQHDQLEALATTCPLSRHAIAKAALSLGLQEIIADPNWLVRIRPDGTPGPRALASNAIAGQTG